ncbi:PP2C family protein-serine/threonine phosphatase [Oceanobacillus chungangensis]|uniref:Phosphoserine phosphatase n=1 Tax=Oceanobacillus chungangensis TaxID=1229152 RepID=A0A3D8PG91_9BACI|nr:PP2C family protein-serine/threonine phosphatase [Oceanobacillus chungangensis]RDW15094.1 phosphoserine phosphatase [Oceanobacillus chungangensis]
MDKIMDLDISHYKSLLKKYLRNQNEQSLYGVELVSKSFIKNNILPDEIVNLHIQALSELCPDLNLDVKHSMDFLLEAMISYGLALQEVQTLREEQLALKSEISVAANMQETLLGTTVPEVEGLDIGVISVPANQMNGDYHHFVKGNDGSIGIAMADVIGKGIPAALCMSMIKYAIDSYPEDKMSPEMILKNLNRVVERNVDSSMFITMIYSQYLPSESKLMYASAGHEPGFYYNAEKGTFKEIETEGLILGVLPDTNYKRYELEIHEQDMVIFLTDGVTECRDGERFIETEEVLNIIKEYIDLPAQEIVTNVYKHFEKLQDFQLKDDFTLLILRKEV